MTATCGRKCCEQYVKSGPLGSLAKTLLESSRWFSPARRLKWEAVPLSSEKITEKEYSSGNSSPSKPSAQVLSEKVIPSSRLLFRLVPSERPTAGTASGSSQGVLLPTPRATEIVEDPDNFVRRTGDRKSGCMPNLSSMAAYRQDLIPTPTSIDSGSGRINKSPSPNAKERPTIALAAKMGLLPTPMSTEVRHGQRVKELKEAGKANFRSREKGQSGANGLMDYMDFHGMLPTPKAQEAKGNVNRDRGKRNLTDEVSKMIANCPPSDGQGSPQLNPLFVQEMMGFPADWLVSPFLSGEQNP